jgi:hypothetical protein
MTLVDSLLAYGIVLFILLIIATIFLGPVFSSLGTGQLLLFVISILVLIFTGVV